MTGSPLHPSVATASLLVAFYDDPDEDTATTTVHIADAGPFRPVGDLVSELATSPAFLAGPFDLALVALVEEGSLLVHLLRIARGDDLT